MANANTEQEKWQEVALVDISYEVLDRANKAMSYREIFKEAAAMKGLSDEELLELLPQVYTEMNLDGRFICISPGQWGLKKWYTTEAIEESIEALARSKGIDDDDDDYGYEEEEVGLDADYVDEDDFDHLDVDEDLDADLDDEDLDFDTDEEVEFEDEVVEEEFEDEEVEIGEEEEEL